jgi:hypothetical protein
LGLALLVVGESGAWAVGNLVSTGYWIPSFLPRVSLSPLRQIDRRNGGPLIVCALTGTLMM